MIGSRRVKETHAMNASVFDQLAQFRLIPVVTIDDAQHAEPLAQALIRGGLPCAEVTFRTDAAADAIRAMTRRAKLLVGAGTVLSVEQARSAVHAGAQFIVTPGLHDKVVDHCIEQEIPIAPGVATASEIAWAFDRGLRVVKFFPAESLGGARTLKALCAPYRTMRFIPTGGINLGNLLDYLRVPQVLAVGGSWLAAARLYAHGDYSAVEQLVRAGVNLVAQADSAHKQASQNRSPRS
jgi:2-dehydro-3-deoxyphosphogluconate aldolase/(4S)-4-hydroxy-2-oxoglutarate aldolase